MVALLYVVVVTVHNCARQQTHQAEIGFVRRTVGIGLSPASQQAGTRTLLLGYKAVGSAVLLGR
jgi:hypothetical protein